MIKRILYALLTMKPMRRFVSRANRLIAERNISKLKVVSPKTIFPDIYNRDIILRNIDLQFGNMGHNELCILIYIIKYLKPKNIFEFGTFNGITALQIALNTEENAVIYTLNLPSSSVETKYSIGDIKEELEFPNTQPGRIFEDNDIKNKIIQLYGDSAVFNYSKYINMMDFVFVDASHEYEYVKNDTNEAFMMLKKEGIIMWHDYPNSEGVKSYLEELSEKFEISCIENTHFAIYIKANK